MERAGWVTGGLYAAAVAATRAVTPWPASAVTIVEHTNTFDACHFEAGDVPGVNQSFAATCVFVHEPTGNLQVVARGQLPAGSSLTSPFHGTVDCSFNGVHSTGTIVATKIGKVVAECVVPGGA